jgi:uncharacterized protein (DUF1330 family)
MSGLSNKLLLISCGIVIGILVDDWIGAISSEVSSDNRSGFLIVGGRTIDSDGLGPYMAAAGSAIANAGLNRVARSVRIAPEQVLEGRWPYEGFVAIEHVQSMDQLKSYWRSDQFQEIKKLREGKIEIDFVIAVDAFSRNMDK